MSLKFKKSRHWNVYCSFPLDHYWLTECSKSLNSKGPLDKLINILKKCCMLHTIVTVHILWDIHHSINYNSIYDSINYNSIYYSIHCKKNCNTFHLNHFYTSKTVDAVHRKKHLDCIMPLAETTCPWSILVSISTRAGSSLLWALNVSLWSLCLEPALLSTLYKELL